MSFLGKDNLDTQISQKLQKIESDNLTRHRFGDLVENIHLNFSSNDYLGLASDPVLKKAYQQGFDLYPCGSGASQVITGYHAAHRTLERKFSDILEVDDALLFSSGYAANLALMKMLSILDTQILIDKRIHASIYDGIELAQGHATRFPHQDLTRLNTLLRSAERSSIVVTEGIFSMTGEMAPLDQIVQLCRQSLPRSLCIVDEAHSFGVIGPHGLGLAAFYSMKQHDIPLRVIPFGKSLAGQGAVVVGRRDWIALLLQQGRSAIYSTAMSPAIAYGLNTALELSYTADEKRQKIFELVRYFRFKITTSLFKWRESVTPIQQLQCGCPRTAQQLEQFLLSEGILCRAIRQPTVPRLETGLRVVLNYCHDTADIDTLFRLIHAYQG